MFLFAASPVLADVEPDMTWYNPDDQEFFITKEAEFLGLGKLMSDQDINFHGVTIMLTRDLDFTEAKPAWTPIGRNVAFSAGSPQFTGVSTEKYESFQGTFDGRQNKITYSRETDDIANGSFALFLDIGTEGKVQNLKIDVTPPKFESIASNEKYFVGGIAVRNEGIISDCVVSADMKGAAMYTYAGGIAAGNEGVIERCSVTGSFSFIIDANSRYTFGGIAGDNYATLYSSRQPIIRDCEFFAESVTVNATPKNMELLTGGIAGQNRYANAISMGYPRAVIENCRSEASFLSTNTNDAKDFKGYVYAGGIVGSAEERSIIRNSSFKGSLSGMYVGGIIGGNADRNGTAATTHGIVSGCASDFELLDEGMSCYSSVVAGGIAGFLPRKVDIENCYASAELKVAETKTGVSESYTEIGGIVGEIYDNSVSIKNCVSAGEKSTSRNLSNDYVWVGGLIGYQNGAVTIENCVSLSKVMKPETPASEKYYGALFGISDNEAKSGTSNCRWLENAAVNNGLPISGSDASFISTENVHHATAVSALPATAAILSPVYGEVNGIPLHFEAKIYPEGASGADTISGSWSVTDGAGNIALTQNASNALTAAVIGLAEGPGRISFAVSELSKLFGDFAPTLTAGVNVLQAAFSTDAAIQRVYAKVGDVDYVADGDGLIVVPNGTNLTNLPIYAETRHAGATVSYSDTPGGTFNPFTDGTQLDFTNARVSYFRATAQDGTTLGDEFGVYVMLQSDAVKAGTFVTTNPAEWKSYVVRKPDGTVGVSVRIPIDAAQIDPVNGFTAPYIIDVSTQGINRESVVLKIVRDDGVVVHDYRNGYNNAGVSAPDPYAPDHSYTLIFSAVCGSDANYGAAAITGITWLPDESSPAPYEQVFAGGINIKNATTVEDEVIEKKPPSDRSGGGCDAGLGGGTLALAVLALAAAKRKK
jgi:hypothetical protein